ncbi:site-specific integrase [Halosquirtibacter xylanolyticus]|uniref:site-specific integrase n=1 Tax=Halosquirtibacter xylanolyticus TaxID=3374599 RepID=UPI00374A2CAF|nr:site-specific integrase [Prolixibacteraceae bacterium]
MATINLILDTRRIKKDGTYPIKLFIRHKKSMAYISTKYSIPEKYWDHGRIKRNCPGIDNIRRCNNDLSSLLNDADDHMDDLEKRRRLDRMTSKQIATYIKNGGEKELSDIDFTAYIQEYIQTIKNDSTKEKYKSTLSTLKRYLQSEPLYFDDITKPWLNRFKEWRYEHSSASTTNIDLRNIRALYNRAIDVDEIIGQEHYPFRKFEFLEATSRNLRLPKEKIIAIRDFNAKDPNVNMARDFFMLSFYLIGINNSDIYSIDRIDDGRIEYDRHKTNKRYSIKVEPEALGIIERQKGNQRFLIYQERYANFKNLTKAMNKFLKVIGQDDKVNVPNLVMYHARHSWAGIAAKKPIGAGKPMIAQALGHGKKTVTDSYFDYDWELVDDLNRKVLDQLV